MKIEPPPLNASSREMRDYLVKVHACVEEGNAATRQGNRVGVKGLFTGRLSLGVLVAIIVPLGTMAAKTIKWMDTMEQSVSAMNAKIDFHTTRFDHLSDHMRNIDNRLTEVDERLTAIAKPGRR
jgi:septal ring factor EnvC (AmiA/AmiB activator)